MNKLTPKLKHLTAVLLASAFTAPAAFANDNPYLMRVVVPGAKAEVVAPKLAKWALASQAAISLPSTNVNATQSSAFTIKNIGNGEGSLSYLSISGVNSSDFSLSPNCAGIKPNGTCSIAVAFTPQASGTRTASVLVGSDTLTLSGVGLAAAWSQTSGTALGIPDAVVGVTKSATIAVKNSGNAAGSFTIPALTGANPGEFSVASNCNSIPANNTCNLTVSFTPTAEGQRTATLKVGADTVAITGVGLSSAGTDPYYANVVLQMHFDGTAGTNALIPQKGPTPTGTATIAGGTYALAGTGSMKLTASTTVSIAGSTTLQLPGDYTLEYWFMPTAVPTNGSLMLKQPAGSYPGYGATLGGSGSTVELYTWFGNGVNGTTGGLMYAKTNLALNQWYHIVQETIGGEHRFYVNGTLISSGGSQVDSNSTAPIVLASGVTGYMDELRVTKGVGRYSGAFTPSRTATPDK